MPSFSASSWTVGERPCSWESSAVAVVAVTALVLLVNAETTRALGIQGPGNASQK